MIEITVNGRYLDPLKVQVGMEMDHNAEQIHFNNLPEIAEDQRCYLNLMMPDETADVVELADGVYTITRNHTSQPGVVRAWLMITKGTDVVWHSDILQMVVGNLPSVEEAIEQQYPTALEEALAKIDEALKVAEELRDVTVEAKAAAVSVENMTGNAATLLPEQSATVTISKVDGHYHLDFGIPQGATGDAASIVDIAVAYQNSLSGTTVPMGTWLDQQPITPQGQYLWTRTTLTWNNGQTTTMYSVSRMGIDGSGSVVSVNGISPDANGNVPLPIDTTPTQGSQNPVTSGGAYAAIADKQDTLTFDSTPTSGSTNPVTSGGVYSSEQSIRNTVSIVATENTAPKAITAGEFVQWQGSIYAATANIPSGGTLSTSNLQAVPNGGLNALKSSVDTLNSKFATYTRRIFKTSAGANRNAVIHAWMSDLYSILGYGEVAMFTGIYQGSMYCGFIWHPTGTVIFGVLFSPNSAGGFYFRDSSNDEEATTTDF